MRPSPNDYKDLNPSDRNVRVVDGSLILKNIQKSHEGYYLCKASNGIGGISAVAKMSGKISFHNNAHRIQQPISKLQIKMFTNN